LADIIPRLVPCPFGWFDQPIALPRFFEFPLPASYIFLKDDRAAPRARYEAMAARLCDPLGWSATALAPQLSIRTGLRIREARSGAAALLADERAPSTS
jgi:hypothetical protein